VDTKRLHWKSHRALGYPQSWWIVDKENVKTKDLQSEIHSQSYEKWVVRHVDFSGDSGMYLKYDISQVSLSTFACEMVERSFSFSVPFEPLTF
jgi:hypothetical protein